MISNSVRVEVGDQRVARTLLEPAGRLEQLRGLARRGLDTGEAALIYDGPVAGQLVHMLGVGEALTVVATRDGRVRAVTTLAPWTGWAWVRGERLLELPADTEVAVGDRLTIERDAADDVTSQEVQS